MFEKSSSINIDFLGLTININKVRRKKQRLNYKFFKSLGVSTYFSLDKKISGRVLGSFFLRRNFLRKILRKFKKNPKFIHHFKLRKFSLQKIKKQAGRKYTRIKAFLPLRGQRTHTNAKTERNKKKKKDI